MAHVLAKVLTDVAPRIGLTGKERLAWVIKLVLSEGNGVKTPGDWQNLQLYIAVFIALGRREALTSTGKKVDMPSQREAEEIFLEWRKIVQAALERKPITKPPYRNERIEWFKGQYLEAHDYDESWLVMTTRPLVDLIQEYGHLVKQCQAPAVRAKKKSDICGKWFVADRPNQDHCTRACRSRASTKAKRERDRKKKPKK